MLTFGTKSQTLSLLAPKLKRSTIGESVTFTVADWANRGTAIVESVQRTFADGRVIVRSSAVNEDGAMASQAGVFKSVQDVAVRSEAEISRAVERVIASYGPHAGEHDEVLVQMMITAVSMSGVVFTHDLNTGAPYYVVNYDDVSGRTDTITSGATDTSRTLLIHRGHVKMRSGRFNALLTAVQEVEELFPGAALDIEFAVTERERIYLFQVRQLAVRKNWNRHISVHVDQALIDIHRFLEAKFKPTFGALGHRSVFGEMPDWNPAEMIGSVPRPLARSLYEMLITDSVWAEARAAMGYRDQTGRPLMVDLGGRAYVDVRESFNSYTPAALRVPLAEHLVCSWLDYLTRHPEEHDKVEFNVAVTAFTFDFEDKLAIATPDLTEAERKEIAEAFRVLTQNIVFGDDKLIDDQLNSVALLDERRRAILRDGVCDQELLCARQLLQECLTLGTPPFAILARCGFIAESLLRSCSAVSDELQQLADRLRGSVVTVLSKFLADMQRVSTGKLDADEFMEEFGHLRPGTYDILALRYDQRDDLLSAAERLSVRELRGDREEMSREDLQLVGDALVHAGFPERPEAFVRFVQDAIAGREYAKLLFTRNLSDALELIAAWGERNRLSREELSFLTIDQILRSLSSTSHDSLEEQYRRWSDQARERYDISLAIRLPYLISEPSDAHVIPLLKSKANFITQKRVEAHLCFVTGRELEPLSAAGRIVLIESADPGYDWIFLEPIAGLITRYGGSNSHMAIRCAELSIPAAIGCGEQQFDSLKGARSAMLDCGAGVISPVK